MSNPPIHDQKRLLIETALSQLHDARDLDERPTLHIDKWTAWYDETIPLITDIKVIAAAMEAESYIRRSEQIAAEPLEPGRRTDLEQPVTRGVTSSPAAKMERSRMRVVGKHAAAARAHVKNEAQANRPVTRKSIVRHVKQIAKSRTQTVRLKPSPTGRPLDVVQQDTDARTLVALDRMADGTRRTVREVERIVETRIVDYLRYVRLLPWLTIDRTADGIIFIIDQELRAICERRQPRPALEGRSIHDWLKELRAEITRQRKENNDACRKANWRSDLIHTGAQSALLDWIEEQLDRIP